jgi:hypothetical protein
MSQLRGWLAAVARSCWRIAQRVGKLFEQSVPIGNVPCLCAFQSPEKHLCGGRIVAASLERSDHLALMGDVPLPAMEKAFGLSKKLFQGGAVHPAA